MQKIVLEGKQRLAQGLWVIIFPEGTRVLPGEKKRFGIGGAM
jgi:1-acyl-sn-glycerol-3-phosphate acyltransferase